MSRLAGPWHTVRGGPVGGCGTVFNMKLPVMATASSVSGFFRKGLQPGWRLVEMLPARTVPS